MAEWMVLAVWLLALPAAIGWFGGEGPGCAAIAVAYALLFTTTSILSSGDDVDRSFLLRVAGDDWVILAVAGATYALRTGAWRDRRR